jgi:hypothetical protein
MPEEDRSTEGQLGLPSVDPVLVRKPPKPASATGKTFKAVAAEMVDRAVKAHPKAESLAREMGLDPSFLSRLRSGEKTANTEHLLGSMNTRESFMAGIAPLCEEHGLAPPRPIEQPTREQMAEMALVFVMAEGGMALREFHRFVERVRGWSQEQVEAAR